MVFQAVHSFKINLSTYHFLNFLIFQILFGRWGLKQKPALNIKTSKNIVLTSKQFFWLSTNFPTQPAYFVMKLTLLQLNY